MAGYLGSNDMKAYGEAVKQTWERLANDADLQDFIRYATLAANAHNTQPWRFHVSGNSVTFLPDFRRRTPVVDPDDHHLFVSLGCAAENFILAAQARGRHPEIHFNNQKGVEISIDLSSNGNPIESEIFRAIPERQCTRSEYDGRAVSTSDLNILEKAAQIEGVHVKFITEKKPMESLLDYVITGNTAQMEDPAFVGELKRWLRFNHSQALETRDGLFSVCAGNPTMPTWLAKLVFGLVFRTKSENDKYVKQIRSSSGIAIFITEKNDQEHWVNVGRSYQRFALQATALGIRQAFINQAVEVPDIRSDFAKWLDLGDNRPDIVVRFGYALPLPKSLRRSVNEILI